MITQRLVLIGGSWCCAGCRCPLAEGLISHPDNCPELGAAIAAEAEAIAHPPYLAPKRRAAAS